VASGKGMLAVFSLKRKKKASGFRFFSKAAAMSLPTG
jgi:hypothetical protein